MSEFCGEGASFTSGYIELHVPVRHPSKDIKGTVRSTDMKPKGQV